MPRCTKCGELLYDNDAFDQMYAALRTKVHLLTPEQIRDCRGGLGLSEQELGQRIGIEGELIFGFENGLRIQTRVVDNLLRVFFALPAVRAALIGPGQDPGLGTQMDCTGTTA